MARTKRMPVKYTGGLRYQGRVIRGLGLIEKRRQAALARRRASFVSAISNARTGGFLGREVKFVDTANTGTALVSPTDAAGGEIQPGSGVTGCLSAPAQGDGESNRDGRKCVLKSVFIEGRVDCSSQTNQTATENASQVFIALVQDRQTNGVTINSEDVYTNPGASGALAASPLRDQQQLSRFKVLATRTFTLQNPNMSWDGTNIEQNGLSKPFKIYKKLNIPVNFTGTTADVANVVDNSLHLIAYTSSTGLAPNIRYNCRVRFVG